MRNPPATQQEARERLTAVRNALGWTNVQLGRYFDMSRVSVHKWLRGKSNVPSHVVDAIPFLEAFAEEVEEQERKEHIGELLSAGAMLGAVLIYKWVREDV